MSSTTPCLVRIWSRRIQTKTAFGHCRSLWHSCLPRILRPFLRDRDRLLLARLLVDSILTHCVKHPLGLPEILSAQARLVQVNLRSPRERTSGTLMPWNER